MGVADFVQSPWGLATGIVLAVLAVGILAFSRHPQRSAQRWTGSC